MNRLFIDELTSIGVVDKGDNPDATILFYKRSEHPSVVSLQAYLDRLDRGIADSRAGNERIRETINQINDERPEPMPEYIDDVMAEVNRQANVYMKEDPTLTEAQAKAKVWRDNPDLVAKSRTALRSVPKPADIELVARIRKVVNARAAALQQNQANWSMTAPQLRNMARHTPDGEAITALERALIKNTQRKSRTPDDVVAKSMPAGMDVLKRWEQNPAEGLR